MQKQISPNLTKNSVLFRRSLLIPIFCVSMLFLLILSIENLSTASAHPQRSKAAFQNDDTAIAYVASSIDSQQIRLINPDGSGDRLFWQVPTEVAPVDGIGLGGLSWHPQATELAFDSGHDWKRSLNIRDLYMLSGNGQNLRRVSRPPEPSAYDQFESGTVKFALNAFEQGDVQLYIEGMDQHYDYFARIGETWTFTFTLADFGEGHRQYIRIWDPDPLDYPCNYSEEGWVDVVPNTFTDVGTLNFSVVTADRACPVLFSPSWTQNGAALNYVHREATISSDPENNLWQIMPSPPIGTVGEQLLNLYDFVSRGKIYRVVSGPTAERADEIFFLETGTLNDQIYFAQASDASNNRRIGPRGCPRITCDILDIEWLPDGSGIIFSRFESGISSSAPAAGGVLYQMDYATGEMTEIIRLPDEGIGNFSISPDGSTIVFERSGVLFDGTDKVRFGPRLLCPCALWMVDSDGSNLRLLTEDGRQPAWSPLAPSGATQPVSTPTPSISPSPTAASGPTRTPRPVLTPVWLPYVN